MQQYNSGPVPGPNLDDFGTPGVARPAGFREGPRSDEHMRPEFNAPRIEIDPSRRRMRSAESVIDPFDIADIVAKYAPTRGDPAKGNIDNEIDFNWKRYETYGKPDYAEQRMYGDQGWKAVQHHHFPGRFAPPGTQGPVIIKDMVLMERPMRLTVQARNEELLSATRAMQVNRQKVAQTPEGHSERVVYA